jgi:hypothetical protein
MGARRSNCHRDKLQCKYRSNQYERYRMSRSSKSSSAIVWIMRKLTTLDQSMVRHHHIRHTYRSGYLSLTYCIHMASSNFHQEEDTGCDSIRVSTARHCFFCYPLHPPPTIYNFRRTIVLHHWRPYPAAMYSSCVPYFRNDTKYESLHTILFVRIWIRNAWSRNIAKVIRLPSKEFNDRVCTSKKK